jgi:hypothetical protein
MIGMFAVTEIFGKIEQVSAHILHRGRRWLRQGRQPELNAFKYSSMPALLTVVDKSQDARDGDGGTNAPECKASKEHNSWTVQMTRKCMLRRPEGGKLQKWIQKS